MKLNLDNYESWLVDRMEGLLDPAQEAELDAFLELHPELQEDAALMEMTRLVPDQEVIFTDKASLKKEEGGRILALFTMGRLSMAAAAVLLAFVGIRFLTNPAESTLATGYQSAAQQAAVPVMAASAESLEARDSVPGIRHQGAPVQFAVQEKKMVEENKQPRETQFANYLNPVQLQQLPAVEKRPVLHLNDFEEQYALINNYDYENMMKGTTSGSGPETIVDKMNDAMAIANEMSSVLGFGKKDEEEHSGSHMRTTSIRILGIEYYNRKRINQ